MAQRLQIRTGWISFAAVLAGIAGVYNLVCGIAAASSDDALQQRAQALFNVDLTTLGWIWIVLGAVQLFTAIQIWRRVHSGLILGVVWCGINAALTTLAIFTYPLWAILMFALQISILYGLLGHADEFE
jgi:hypothetical protein